MDLRAQIDECLILRGRDYNESDRLLTVYSRHWGKLSCLARGVRKPKSRLKAATLPFVCSRLEFSPAKGSGQSLRLITQGETLYSLAELREDLSKIGLANYVAEMLDCATPQEKPQENLYILAVSTLLLAAAIEKPRQQYLLLKFFELRLLGELGWRPGLMACARCGRDVDTVPTEHYLISAQNPFFAAPALGGIVCGTCRQALGWGLGEARQPGGRDLGLSKGGVKIMRCLQDWEPRRFLQLNLNASLRQEVNQALWAYLDYHLGAASRKARENLLIYGGDILSI